MPDDPDRGQEAGAARVRRTLERERVSVEAIRKYEARHPEVTRATYKVPHYGLAGTAANYVAHLAKLGLAGTAAAVPARDAQTSERVTAA